MQVVCDVTALQGTTFACLANGDLYLLEARYFNGFDAIYIQNDFLTTPAIALCHFCSSAVTPGAFNDEYGICQKWMIKIKEYTIKVRIFLIVDPTHFFALHADNILDKPAKFD